MSVKSEKWSNRKYIFYIFNLIKMDRSKKLYIWKFNVDNKDYTIELYNSVVSGKKKVVQNGQIIYENNK